VCCPTTWTAEGTEIANGAGTVANPTVPGQHLPATIRVIRRVIADERFWIGVYVLVICVATGICVARRCNNFLIFRAAFRHLVDGRDLYARYPAEYGDLFKYSPTFALLFAPFAQLPYALALFAWNGVNISSIYLALRLALPSNQRLEAVQLVGIGLVTTVDGTQSNGVVAAIIVLAFAAMERRRILAAATAVAVGGLIKLFPLAAISFAWPRKDRVRFGLFFSAALATLVAVPLVVASPAQLAGQYHSWFAMGSVDALDRGASVMRLLHVVVGYDGPNWPIQAAATLMLALPVLLRPARWLDAEFRRSFLASVLVYCVIFNHKAEQPSFIIGLTGVAIWYASSPSPRGTVRSIVTGAAFAATVPTFLAVTAPGLLARSVDLPLLIECACCAAAWFTIQGELLELFPDRMALASPEAELAAISDQPAV
jgi:hypothetical protein